MWCAPLAGVLFLPSGDSRARRVALTPIVTSSKVICVKRIQKLKKDLGYYLRVYRAERNLSQSDLALALGVSSSAVSLIEAGKRFPGRLVTLKIRKMTGAPVHVLLGDIP